MTIARARPIGLAVLLVGLLLAAMTFAPGARAETGQKALVLDSMVTGGAGSDEAQNAIGNGFTVDVVSDPVWTAMTAAQFADYQLVIVGDPTCGALSQAVSANAQNLADAVMARAGGNTKVGNRFLIGTDPRFHHPLNGQPNKGEHVISTGIDFTGVRDGATNLYLTFSCFDQDYNGNGTGDGVEKLLPLLTIDPTPDWAETQPAPCTGEASLIANNDQFAPLQSNHLQDWFCSAHITFPRFPTDWTPLAVSTDSPTDPVCGIDVDTGETACGEPHLLIAGTGIVVEAPNLDLDPPNATNPVGTTHTVTATVTNQDGTPRGGVLVDFIVTGANAGASGTCVPADCTSGPDGKVTFTYTGANAGDDTINAAIEVDGSRQTATATKTWVARAVRVTINNNTQQEGNSGTTPMPFTVSLDGPATGPVSVDYATADVTATAPADYLAQNGTVTFAAGETSKTVDIDIVGDLVDELNESFTVNLSNASGAEIANDEGVGLILDDDRNGTFSCRATALRIGTTELFTANPPDKPCRDDEAGLLNVAGPGFLSGTIQVNAQVLRAKTDATPNSPATTAPALGDSSVSQARAVGVVLRVGTLGIRVGVLEAAAAATCGRDAEGGLSPTLSSSSSVANLTIGTRTVDVNGPVAIPIPAVGTLYLNHTSKGNGVITRRALWLDSTLLPDVVIGEARANHEGNPCEAGTPDLAPAP